MRDLWPSCLTKIKAYYSKNAIAHRKAQGSNDLSSRDRLVYKPLPLAPVQVPTAL